MRIYLVQHGKPLPKEQDPERPLSEEGRRGVAGIAEMLTKAKVRPSCVYHSGKLRAQQTAEILAEKLAVQGGPQKRDNMAPLDEPRIIAEQIEHFEDQTMLVGHLPHLSKLTSLLVTGDPEKPVVRFQQGGIVCLEQEEDQWAVSWMLVPQIVGL